jgi:hypothetical protein
MGKENIRSDIEIAITYNMVFNGSRHIENDKVLEPHVILLENNPWMLSSKFPFFIKDCIYSVIKNTIMYERLDLFNRIVNCSKKDRVVDVASFHTMLPHSLLHDIFLFHNSSEWLCVVYNLLHPISSKEEVIDFLFDMAVTISLRWGKKEPIVAVITLINELEDGFNILGELLRDTLNELNKSTSSLFVNTVKNDFPDVYDKFLNSKETRDISILLIKYSHS